MINRYLIRYQGFIQMKAAKDKAKTNFNISRKIESPDFEPSTFLCLSEDISVHCKDNQICKNPFSYEIFAFFI